MGTRKNIQHVGFFRTPTIIVYYYTLELLVVKEIGVPDGTLTH